MRSAGRRDKPPPGGIIHLPDGTILRGAKKGGITDHIAGPHLIPNVGREAMVPAEVIRRARPAPKKPTEKPPPQKEKAPPARGAAQAGGKRRRRERHRRSRSRDEERSGTRSRARSARRSRSKESPPRSEGEAAAEAPQERAKSLGEQEEEGRREKRQELGQDEAAEREKKRRDEERRMLQELDDARKKRQELEAARRKNLGGAFALTEDDINAEENEDTQRARAARELARAEERRAARERLSHKEPGSGAPAAASSSSSSHPDRGAAGAAAPLRLVNRDSVTAADIDGSLHEHKFAKVWKDWDASKKDDPGEIAKQFMRVSAVKRRGYCTPKRSAWSRSRSRSKSRSRRR
mmetsp:Transcript_58936/g.189536  ORF Transcript_58936/g.189536 Transcript_58936/m.189536 type:complete len:351 (+) Transcript_58936:1-1053(+)